MVCVHEQNIHFSSVSQGIESSNLLHLYIFERSESSVAYQAMTYFSHI